jgi:cell division protein FtsA
LDEIIENVWYQVPNEFVDKLLGGIILTGGGSNMKNIEKAFRNHTHLPKVRVAKFVQQTINSKNPDISAKDGTMNTILGLLEKGDINCAGEEITNDLFNTDRPLQSGKITRTGDRDRQGVVITEAEKRAQEEARKQREAIEAANRQAEREKQEREKKEKKENSIANKTIKSLKTFFKKMVEEEE